MVTQEQIARKLGISRQLVTFALAGYPQVSNESRKRILEAAKKMGYRPNPYARALKRQHTGIIALWIPDQISSHYTHVARELSRLLKKEGKELIVSEIRTTTTPLMSNVPVDGVIAVDAPDAIEEHLKSSLAGTLPLVSMGAYKSEQTDSVQVDLYTGAQIAIKHLVDSGFRQIIHATFVRKDNSYASRRMGYADFMLQAKLKPEYLYYQCSEEQRPITRQLIQDYIAKKGVPEAIFCHSDDVAIGIYRGLCDITPEISRKVALIGCDGIQDTEYLEQPITTLVQPVSEMCSIAWKFLQERIKTPNTKRQSQIFTPTLAIRESTKRAR